MKHSRRDPDKSNPLASAVGFHDTTTPKPSALATGARLLSRALRDGVLLSGLLFLCLGSVASAWAAAPPHIDEKGIRIGLRDGSDVARSRNGVWTPIAIPLQAGADDVPSDSYRLIVETTDGEAVPYRSTTAVPAIPAQSRRVVFAYVRPGSTGATFTVVLQRADGSEIQAIHDLSRDPSKKEILEPQEVLYLSLGSLLHDLRTVSGSEGAESAAQMSKPDHDVAPPGFAAIEDVADMPDRWFGYEAVDAIVMTTASDTFVEQLLSMDKVRRDALLDWVQRGGRLVLSVGRNQRRVAKWLEKMPLIDGVLQGKVIRPSLPNLQRWCGTDPRQKQLLRNIELACVQPGPNMHGVVYEDPTTGDAETRPVLWQSSCGLGRVILVAFDLDAPPFSTWEGRGSFWKKLQEEIVPHRAVGEANLPIGPLVQAGELATDLKRALENFQDVPVVSFGRVALLILFYICLVGPLDYFFLKKVCKRLELTWISFPVLVLVISTAAYTTAHYVKGDDLRINKIDLVDIDLHAPGQVYGRSWFTLFSPDVRNYTIGLERSAPDWVGCEEAADTELPTPPVMIAVMDSPEAGLGGSSPSLFRRPYEYAPQASGLLHVPIPKWAARTFTASWRGPLKDAWRKDRPPIFQALLRISRDGKALSGTITNHLPTELQGAVLFFQGQWYQLGDLAPGEVREVSPLFEPDIKPHSLQEWFIETKLWQSQHVASFPESPKILQALLFHGAPGGGQQPNSGLRTLDEGWRLLSLGEGQQRRYREEAILVARTPPRSGDAEKIAQEGISPTRLWLDVLPDAQLQRPALPGRLQQETYIRIYIPLVRSR